MHKEVVEEKEVVRKDAVDIKARLLSAMTKVPLLTLLSKANRSNYRGRRICRPAGSLSTLIRTMTEVCILRFLRGWIGGGEQGVGEASSVSPSTIVDGLRDENELELVWQLPLISYRFARDNGAASYTH